MSSARLLIGTHPKGRIPPHSVITIGVFDGVHIAHQQLIRTALALARKKQALAGIITFDPDPQHVLHPSTHQPALMPLVERLAILKRMPVDWIWVLPFTVHFSRTPAQDFIEQILVKQLGATAVVVGEGFSFGKDRTGDLSLLRRFGAPHGMRVVSVPAVLRGGEAVSSSRIRWLISEGDLRQARQLLGRPPALYGKIVSGKGRGRPMGFPTANVQLVSQALPPQGVYAVNLRRIDTQQSWKGVMNFGVRPTFGSGPVVCEVHLLGFQGNLLGKPVAVSLVGQLRSERHFPSPGDLQKQIRRDVTRARVLLARLA